MYSNPVKGLEHQARRGLWRVWDDERKNQPVNAAQFANLKRIELERFR